MSTGKGIDFKQAKYVSNAMHHEKVDKIDKAQDCAEKPAHCSATKQPGFVITSSNQDSQPQAIRLRNQASQPGFATKVRSHEQLRIHKQPSNQASQPGFATKVRNHERLRIRKQAATKLRTQSSCGGHGLNSSDHLLGGLRRGFPGEYSSQFRGLFGTGP